MQADSLPAEPQGKSKNTGVGSLALLQGISPIQELNRSLLHCRQILYQLSYQGSPLKTKHYVNLFCGFPMILHVGVMLGWALPSPMGKSHVKAKLGEGLQNSPYFPCHLIPTALLSPQGSSLFTPGAALLQVGLSPLRWQLLLVMLQGGQVGTRMSSGCCGRRPWP